MFDTLEAALKDAVDKGMGGFVIPSYTEEDVPEMNRWHAARSKDIIKYRTSKGVINVTVQTLLDPPAVIEPLLDDPEAPEAPEVPEVIEDPVSEDFNFDGDNLT
jgi:hypothetical protein